MTLVKTRLARAMTGDTGRGSSTGLQPNAIRAGKTR